MNINILNNEIFLNFNIKILFIKNIKKVLIMKIIKTIIHNNINIYFV